MRQSNNALITCYDDMNNVLETKDKEKFGERRKKRLKGGCCAEKVSCVKQVLVVFECRSSVKLFFKIRLKSSVASSHLA
jgi:hypothetical protein